MLQFRERAGDFIYCVGGRINEKMNINIRHTAKNAFFIMYQTYYWQ